MPPEIKHERRTGGGREDKRSTVGRTAHAKACGPFLFPPDWARGCEKNG